MILPDVTSTSTSFAEPLKMYGEIHAHCYIEGDDKGAPKVGRGGLLYVETKAELVFLLRHQWDETSTSAENTFEGSKGYSLSSSREHCSLNSGYIWERVR